MCAHESAIVGRIGRGLSCGLSMHTSRVTCVSDTLLIIDGHSMAFRAFYALPADRFVTHSGQHTNAVYGFIKMMVKMLQEEKPTHVAVAFDVSRHSFRTEEYPEYKGTRDATPEPFKGQVELISQVLELMGIRSLRKDGYEADDILATLAHRGEKAGMRVLVASGDRDSFQTVTENVTVLYPGASTENLKGMTPAAIEEKYGVPPFRYPEIAALVGETSDNLPGVPGIGPKTAAKLINEFDGLDNLMANADQVKGKRGEALREHGDDVARNRRLNRLLTDLDLGVELGDLVPGATQKTELLALFDTLEFGRLRNQVLAVSVGDDSVEESGNEADQAFWTAPLTVSVASAATDISGWARSVGHIDAIWADGEGIPAHGHIDLLALSAGSRFLVIDPTTLSPVQDQALVKVLKHSDSHVVHDAKALSHALAGHGWAMAWPSKDVQLAAYLARPDSKNVEIKEILNRYFNIELPEEEKKTDALFEIVGSGEIQERIQRCARICYSLPFVWKTLSALLADNGELDLLTQMELPVSRVLAKMEATGIAVDSDELRSQSTQLGFEVDAARKSALDVIGEDVNLSSPKQLQRILFEVLDLPKTKKTKTGYTTNAEALADLREKTRDSGGPGFVFLDSLLMHRDRIKLKQMVDTLISSTNPDGRIHSTFSQVVTTTGRLASKDPNLQNIPARSPDGLKIRSGFVAGPSFESLMSADYSQIEMRIMAHLSGDEGLIEAFATGEDLHKTMAAMVFDTPVEDVTGEQRSRIKATSYGLAYGLSSYGLSAQLHIPVHEAAALRDRYFERFAGVGDYLNSLVDEARINGYTETMFGRRRYLPDLTSSNRQRREMAERAALNAPIQGSAADIVKIAMVNLIDALHQADMKSRVLLQIHDELLLEIAPEERQQAEELVRDKMSSPVQLKVPLDVAVGVGANWMAAAH